MIAMGTLVACGLVIHGQGPSPEAQLVNRAADALGGRDRILAVKSLQLIGYGELAYFNGGSNITGSPDAPQKWQDINDYHRTIDLVNKRMRTEQRLKYNFVFANAAPQLGTNRTNQVVDLEAGARNARLDALTHPVLAVRTALDPATKLANMRRQGAEQLIDMTVKQGDTVTLRFDSASGLPSSISYVVGNGNLGDLTLTTKWVGWIPESGVLVPMVTTRPVIGEISFKASSMWTGILSMEPLMPSSRLQRAGVEVAAAERAAEEAAAPRSLLRPSKSPITSGI
jgi:hypothetical protein